MATIATLGPVTLDIILQDHDDFVTKNHLFSHLRLGTEVEIDTITSHPGGAGVASAITFARSGHQTYFIGNIGHDHAGKTIFATLSDEKVNLEYTYIAKTLPTSQSIILLAPNSQSSVLTNLGAAKRVHNFEVKSLDHIEPDWIFASTLNGDFLTLGRFFRRGFALGAKIMFNPGPAELKHKEELHKLLKYTEILILNREEAEMVVGYRYMSGLLTELNRFCPKVIITDGKNDFSAIDEQHTYKGHIYGKNIPPVDRTGAGAAFASGFLARFAHGDSFKNALHFGSTNAQSVIMQVGATAGIIKKASRLSSISIEVKKNERTK